MQAEKVRQPESENFTNNTIQMKRRGFIKTGLVTMVAGASSHPAFAEIIVPMEDNVTQSEMEHFINEMDISMDRILHSGGKYLNSLLPKFPTETEQNFLRSSLRSLLLIGNFGELSIKGQVHPWMQKRMLYSASEVNHSVITSFDILKEMSDEYKEDIKTALIDDPALGDTILETLDFEARAVGVPAARRRQMRVMGKRIVRRMRHSPEMLIDEYVNKAEKLLLASNSDEALEQLLKMQMGENYSTRVAEAENAAIQWEKLNIPDVSVGYDSIINEQYTYAAPSDLKTKKGLGLLGVGVILTAIGWLSFAIADFNMFGAVIGITIGPILILIALIILLIRALTSQN
jgi:hypothetical protein